jgi:hypothetical protein
MSVSPSKKCETDFTSQQGNNRGRHVGTCIRIQDNTSPAGLAGIPVPRGTPQYSAVARVTVAFPVCCTG